MIEFWVFHCPPGADLKQAQRGDVLCPKTTVFCASEERVRASFPKAVRIERVGPAGCQHITNRVIDSSFAFII